MTETITVALWATNLGVPIKTIEEWVTQVDVQVERASQAGACLLVMPEYCCEQWLSFAPRDLPAHEEIAWMAGHSEPALAALEPVVARHGLALLAGSMPARVDHPRDASPFVNRSWLLLPDGSRIAQDKLCLVPSERNPAGWNLSTGSRVEIVEWGGLRLATLICLDVELPALATLLAPYQIDLLLVPSMTEKPSGYHRVFSCAKARAVELHCIVCAVGCIGAARTVLPRAGNYSGAAVFVPCEESLGHSGVATELPPMFEADGSGPLLIARDLPVGLVRELRRGAAEVWPGAWRADHVIIAEPDSVPARVRPTRAVAGTHL